MNRPTVDVFCAFCKLPRKVYRKKHITSTNVLLTFLLSVLLMYGFWHGPDGRVTMLFSVFIIAAEVFVYFRWRLSLTCPHCGFDPILYKTDRERVVLKVRMRLLELQQSGKHLLRQNNPFLNLPVRYKEQDARNLGDRPGL